MWNMSTVEISEYTEKHRKKIKISVILPSYLGSLGCSFLHQIL